MSEETAILPSLDDVVCPACITAMEPQGEGQPWHLCPNCGYETTGYSDDGGDPTVRQMLDGAETGPTWMDVDLPKLLRWFAAANGS